MSPWLSSFCALLDRRICHHPQCMGFDSGHMHSFSPMISALGSLLRNDNYFLTAHPVLPQFLGPIWLPHFAPVFKNGTYQIYRKTLHISPESSVFLSIWQVLLPRMIELNRPFLKNLLIWGALVLVQNFFLFWHISSTSYNFLTILNKTHYKILKILPNLYPHMGMEGWKYTE